METCKSSMKIDPDKAYTVSEAARILGVHRCTIYAYVSHPEKPLPFIKHLDKTRLLFQGMDLIAYKAAGLPKKGRKRNGKMP